MRNSTRALRYARTWLTGRAATREGALEIEREDRPVSAYVISPADRPGPFPTWVLLHGVTRPGIQHPQLLRFSRALASTGALVFIPEVPEWKELRLAPDATLPTLAASVRALRKMPDARPGPVGLAGFSFGGPQALIAASHESVAEDVAGVVSFGGYCDLARTIRFQMTGEHEWQGRREHVPPDPYGRWVVAANYLTMAPGYGDAGEVAQALWELAAAAGEKRVPAASPEYDVLKEKLRARLASPHRELFDIFAPATGREPDRSAVAEVVEALAEGGRLLDPLMEPTPFLGRLRHRVELLHGRGDTLIPYTETLRLHERLPAGVRSRVTVTRLFGHVKQERFPLARGAAEVWTFFRALGRVLGTV